MPTNPRFAPLGSRTAAALVVLAIYAVACRQDTEPPLPNIFLITADALRADHLSLNGYPRKTSPAIDSFANDAVNFEAAFTPIPKTGPSFATIFSGRHPREHHVHYNGHVIPEDVPLLAELLQAAGYRTAAIVSNGNLDAERGYARGFDFYRIVFHPDSVPLANKAFHRYLEGEWSDPTFVWLHYIDPHGPYSPPRELEGLFAGDALSRDDRRVALLYEPLPGMAASKILGAVPRYQRHADEDRVADYVRRYDAEIRHVDQAFGEVIETLKQRDLYDDSVIVFLSDHGESLGEHDFYFEHGWFAFDPSLRIPLLIKLPGNQRAGSVVPDLVSTVDFLSTLLRIAGVAAELGSEERDLLAEGGDRPPLLIENADGYPVKLLGVRTPELKYLRDLRTGAVELYDLERDPGESTDVSDERPEVAARLGRELDKRLAEAERNASDGPIMMEFKNPAVVENLRALGYVD